jgi:hypothetical protein
MDIALFLIRGVFCFFLYFHFHLCYSDQSSGQGGMLELTR